GAWSVATIKVRGSTAGRLRKAPAVTREVRFRRDVGIWSALRNRHTLAPKRTRAAGRTGGSRAQTFRSGIDQNRHGLILSRVAGRAGRRIGDQIWYSFAAECRSPRTLLSSDASPPSWRPTSRVFATDGRRPRRALLEIQSPRARAYRTSSGQFV